jgi:uroporphyrinogen III methyltransferase/synthase
VPPEAAEQSQIIFRSPHPDWVTFASSSAVTNLASLVGAEVLGKSKVASIGPVTSKTVRQLGLTVNAEANPYTVEGLVEAIVAAQLH